MKLMFRFIRRHTGMFLTALAFLTIETFADLLQPTFMSYIVDKGVKAGDTATVLRYGGIMLCIAAVGAVGAVVRNIYASKTSQLIGKEIRLTIYEKVQTLSFENIDRLQPSAIITRITNDVTQIQNFINGIMRIMLKAPITCIGANILIIIQVPKLFPLMLLILCVAAVLIYCNMKLGYPRFGTMQKKLDKLNGTSREFLSAIRVVKAFRAEKQEQEKFEEAAGEFAHAGISAMRVMAVFGPLINLTVNMGIIVMLWLSGSQVTGEIGKLMACVNYMTQVSFSLAMVSNILNSAVRATASSARVQEILDEVPAQTEVDTLCENLQGSVTIENVTFTYAGSSRPAIEGVSFTVKAGETLGIIGPTGSGKSTLTNLVPRFYDATEGVVKIDGMDVTKMSMDSLRSAIGVVPQKALLFSGSIMQNLRWGDKEASDEEIYKAAESACAASFIEGFPDGYETDLGQGGVNLSGGQKQRLSIARALLKKPKILILDDSTSALDATTESKVLQNIREQARDITVLLVSQRISTVMRADHILCMEDGCIKGFGSHEQLLAGCEAYKAIYKSQIGEESGKAGIENE
ncbi:MAG: ABC transporter ATP-binding protein [Lachnospiraceae bacterium]|nr:ABC transporter ATP-binding protein [Lachnospiraceae bacterium]